MEAGGAWAGAEVVASGRKGESLPGVAEPARRMPGVQMAPSWGEGQSGPGGLGPLQDSWSGV